MAEKPYKYWAFISYSHRDQAWAEWLHRALESYRVPRRLVGRAGPTGAIPRRLFPIFRDADELPSSPNLSGVIDEALQQSRYLIVIVSPYAAVSRWVDEEIQRFRALGRAERILCLIVDGEPHAHLLPDKGLLECFPPSLREAGCAEPVGADVRPHKDSKAAAKLRLIAGLLGVGFDELRRRELRRRRLLIAAWSIATASAAFVLGTLWMTQQAAKHEALAQQALQTHIQTVYQKGRQELQARNEARAAVYLNEAYRLGIDTPALHFMLGRAMRVVEAEKVRIEVDAPVNRVAFSPDTQRLITLDQAHHAVIWDLATRQKLLHFDFPEHSGNAALFSHDGSKLMFRVNDQENSHLVVFDSFSGAKLVELPIPVLNRDSFPSHTQFDPLRADLAFVQEDGHAAIYDFESQRIARVFPDACVSAGYSRDGRWFITGDALGITRLYDPLSGRLLRSLDPLGAPIAYVDTSPDGALLAAGSVNGRFRVWETATGKTRISAAHASRYIGHVFNAIDGTRLLTASRDSARVWDTRSGVLLNSIKFTSNDQRIHISEDGKLLINTGTARLSVIDVNTGVDLFSLDAHAGGANDVDFSSDGRLLATAGRDGSVVLWELPRTPMAMFEHGTGVVKIAGSDLLTQTISGFSPAGELGFSGGSDGALEWWDVRSLTPVQQFATGLGEVTAGAFSADGRRLIAGGPDGLKAWQIADHSVLADIAGLGKSVQALRLSSDGQMVAAALRRGETRLWQLSPARLLKSFFIDHYLAQAFSPVVPSYFATGSDGTVSLWDIPADKPLWSTHLRGESSGDTLTALDFDSKGERVLVVSDHGEIDVLDARTGRVLQHARDDTSESVTTAVFSPDGMHVLLSDDNRCAFLLSLADLKSIRLCGHGTDLASAGYRPDGELIFTAGRDGTAKIWDASGNLLDSVGFHEGRLAYRTTMFNREGDRLLTGADDGTARIWDTSAELRTSKEVAVSLLCRVPWQMNGDDLVSVRPDSSSCEPFKPAVPPTASTSGDLPASSR